MMNYTILEKGGNSTILLNETSRQLIKVLNKNYPTASEVQKFKNEFDILEDTNISGVRKVLHYEEKEQPQLLLEYIAGKNLKVFSKENSLNLREKIQLAVSIAGILNNIHQQGIIHKDVNPCNIVINHDGTAFLIDFGISSKFTLKQPNLGNPEKLEGTLAYISPEQTGRMNHSVDYRTDLYSLGATFYELFTGVIPFQEQGAIHLVHAHLAKIPVSPQLLNSELPEPLAQIILKLLKKNPKDRYQSAFGLVKDLEKCLTLLDDESTCFSLGQDDFSSKLQIPEKLYGRAEETQLILDVFQRVKMGSVELTLVAGYSGTGKSALVNETHRPLASTQGYFVEGKFDQFQRNIPFSAWIQAFQNFIDLLLTENETMLQYWKDLILTALGDNGAVLTEVIPTLEMVIGKQPPVAELGGQEAQNRFNYVIQNFVKVITNEQHPLIIFIDDLQWADLASLHLLQTLVTDQENTHLLCVGAYRDNEISTTHPLPAIVSEIKEKVDNVNEIALNNLTQAAVLEMLEDTLSHQQGEALEQLGQHILSKTRGNAFFTHQFLKHLYEEGMLYFEFESKSWNWNQDKILDAQLTDNVVAFMANKVGKLPTDTQQLLELASCIGNKFDILTLQIIAEKQALSKDLEPAILDGLLIPLNNDRFYKFAHDRIQQAAYSLIPEEGRQAIHLQIGRLLYQSFAEEEREERIFDIVNHYNLATEVFDDKDRENALKLNQEASLKARAVASFNGMLTYIQQAKDLLPENSWETDYQSTLDVYKLLAEAEYLNTHFENLEEYSDLIWQNTNDNLEKAEILLFSLLRFSFEGKFEEAIESGKKALVLLDIEIPTDENLAVVNEELLTKTYEDIVGRGVESILHLEECQNERINLAICILILLDPPAYILGKMDFYTFLSSKVVELSLEHGNAPYSSKGYANLGFICFSLKGQKAGYQIGQNALKLAKNAGEKRLQAQVSLMLANFLMPWNEAIRRSKKFNLLGIQTGLESGEIQYAMYNTMSYACNIFAEGWSLSRIKTELNEKYLGLSLKYKNEFAINSIKAILLTIHTLEEGGHLHLEGLDEEINERDFWQYCTDNTLVMVMAIYSTIATQAYFMLEEYDKAYQKVQDALPYLESLFSYTTSFDYNFYASLTCLKQYETTGNEELLETVKTHQAQMETWADNCPENFLHKYTLVAAEQARIKGLSFGEVFKLYKEAVKRAESQGFIQDTALAAELYAKYLLSVDEEGFAQPYFEKAYQCYQKWGATAKTIQLEERYAQFFEQKKNNLSVPNQSTTHQGTTISTTLTNTSTLDLDTILKANASLAQQVRLKDLTSEILALLQHNSGANKIALLRKESQQWWVDADQEQEKNLLTKPVLLEEYSNLPKQVISYVLRTNHFVLLEDAVQDDKFAKDPYLQQKQSKSVFVVPVKRQENTTALLYLENSLNTAVFHQKRYDLVNALATQLAISIENAVLYENLEQKVAARTTALQKSNEEFKIMNEELRQTQEELEVQRDYVQEKNVKLEEYNNKINSSLNVAQAIQQAILPYEKKLSQLLKDYFVINRPKDVVSGDFYWLNEVQGQTILVVADCTGHGIPGAFMTLIGVNLLDKIVQMHQITDPAQILTALHEEITSVLKQKYTSNNQGMDATVIAFKRTDTQTTLTFAGAKHNMLYYTKQALCELKGVRKSIGGIQNEQIQFANEEISLPAGTLFYIGSDGIEDQNDKDRKKYGRKRLRALLEKVASWPLKHQKQMINYAIDKFMVNTEQRDDILWLGVKL